MIPDETLGLWKRALLAASAWLRTQQETAQAAPSATPVPPAPEVPPETFKPATGQKYDWSTAEAARHSMRLIADEEGLTPQQKNDMSKTLHCESGYHTGAKHPNLYHGKQVSCDYGICQWNDKYHGKEITPDEAMHDPEKAIRLMCQYVKRGQLKLWVCYSAGLYKQYTP